MSISPEESGVAQEDMMSDMSGSDTPVTITNARLVLPEDVLTGSMRVEGDKIAAIDDGAARGNDALDVEGDIVVPGLIELHTDNLEKHLRPRPNVFWPAFAALQAHDAQIAAAGITTVFDAVSLGDKDGREERLKYLSSAVEAILEGRKSGLLRAEHFMHLRCEVPREHVMDLFYLYADDPSVKMISLMDHTPGDRQFIDMEKYKESCLTWFGETEEEFERRVAQEQENQARYSAANREKLAAEARERGFIIASHDDATAEHISEAKALGVSVSEFPTRAEAAKAAHAQGLTTIMGAPNVIRGGSHSGNIAAQELADMGLLDALSSDYMPVSLMGAPFRLAEELGWPLWRTIALVTANPARMAGLDDRGELTAGKRADFVRVRETSQGPVIREVWRAGHRVA